MRRASSFVLSTAACAVTLGSLAALGGPASAAAAPAVCRTTLTGGWVGEAVVASSTDVVGEAVQQSQTVSIDAVTVNYFGELRYRLAAPIRLTDPRSRDAVTSLGGAGYYVDSSNLDRSTRFLACVDKRLRPSS